MSEYEIHAVKYASMDRRRSDNFIKTDDHDGPMPLDFFVWVLRGEAGTFVIDTGFDPETATRRNRKVWRPVAQGLEAIGVEPDKVSDVVITHLHWDHAGNHELFPRARYHLQEKEMVYATGPCMCHHTLNHTFEVADVQNMVKRVFEGRVCFHNGSREIATGLSLHWVGGHSRGLQMVRVKTRRGWIVLASDAAHYYENFEARSPFPIVVDVADMLEGYETMCALASSPQHIIPGHDPLVLDRYPLSGADKAIVRLDADLIG
ncbi:MAG: MBL fold hydrolase [Alphaproteobacteria bacterium HGW-Alphaproteobacteria-1]|jgi:glyoxylase-like metal-dependent hydrolase (beta-lactamase superfamily II)|nr:MAG: MBL fold hydrolase [Alphaproteobacteria bacterium HGW-Alphaproteobacteria-1]